MIIESGLIVAGGLILLFYKMSWSQRMWLLSHPLFMDCIIFVMLYLLHSGTFSGVMVATVGSFVCSGMITLGRHVYGFKKDVTSLEGRKSTVYIPGAVNLHEKGLIK